MGTFVRFEAPDSPKAKDRPDEAPLSEDFGIQLLQAVSISKSVSWTGRRPTSS